MNLTETNVLLEMILQQHPDGIIVLGQSRKVVFKNQVAETLMLQAGLNLEVGEEFELPVDPEFNAEIPLTNKVTDKPLILSMKASVSEFNSTPFMIVAVRDISERVAREDELKEAIIKDELSQLYNRKGFESLCEQQLLLAQRDHWYVTLLFFDLDEFKSINDEFGHAMGDHAIIDFANILNDSFRKSDIIARMGGDEFAVLVISNQANGSELALVRLAEKLHEFNSSHIRPFTIASSHGCARFNHLANTSLKDLMHKADENMYTNKRAKKLSKWAASCAEITEAERLAG